MQRTKNVRDVMNRTGWVEIYCARKLLVHSIRALTIRRRLTYNKRTARGQHAEDQEENKCRQVSKAVAYGPHQKSMLTRS